MKLANTLTALILVTTGSLAFANNISNCKVVEDTFPVPMIDEMSGLTSRADGGLDLALAIQVPRESGGSTVETLAQTFRNPTGLNKNIYKANGLTLELTERPTDGTRTSVNVVARVKGRAEGLKINVLMICEESYK